VTSVPRVLLVSPGYPPSLGGVEGHVAGLATNLVELGWQVEVLTARRGVRGVQHEDRGGVQVTVLPAWSLKSMSVAPRLLWRALRTSGDYDVVHVHSYHALTGLAALRRRGRLVFTPHFHGGGHSRFAKLLHRGFHLLGRRCFENANEVICVSAAERELLIGQYPETANKITVIPNGVNVDSVHAAEPFATTEPVVLSLGRVEPYKNVTGLVQAFRGLETGAKLVILGSGSALDDVRAEASDDSRVQVIGAVSDEEVNRWLRTAAVLVSLSEHEAFGMAPLEAAAGGARLVLSDIAAHREITDAYLSDRAELVTATNLTEVTTAISAALTGPKLGPAVVPSWRDVAEATAAVYRGDQP